MSCYLARCIAIAILWLISTPVCLANPVAIGRYLTVKNSAAPAQHYLLQQSIQVKFPSEVLTIKQAVQFVLQFSGYHLAKLDYQSKPIKNLLAQSLPEVDQQLGPISLQEALLTLVGPDCQLLVDPIHRLVGFQLRPTYTALYATAFSQTARLNTQED